MKRIYHTWEKWECYPAGFYENQSDLYTDYDAEQIYAKMLRDEAEFSEALERVITEWVKSCEHYLSNENMNRIAWLGQAALCIKYRIPSTFRGGFHWLSSEEKKAADMVALKYLNKWLVTHGDPELTLEQAHSKTEANLY